MLRINGATATAVAVLSSWMLLASTILGATGCGGGGDARLATPPATFELALDGTLPRGSAIFSIDLHRRDLAVAALNGFGTSAFNGLIRFNPSTGRADPPIALPVRVDLRGYNAGAGLPRSDGVVLTEATPSFPGRSALFGDKLFLSLNNFDSGSFAYEPGVVLVYDLLGHIFGPPRAIVLTRAGAGGTDALYNPSTLVRTTDPVTGAARLAVVCGDDAYGASPKAAVCLIDPATEALLAVVELGATAAAAGEAVVSEDGRLYVGSATRAEVYEVDLTATPARALHDAADPIALPTDADLNQVAALALSPDGTYLYALSSNDGSLFALDRANGFSVAARLTAFRRSVTDRTMASGGAFKNLPITFAQRPGTRRSAGIELFVATILIDAADQTVTDVRTAIDAVTVDATGLPTAVTTDAVVTPFTPRADLQHLAQHPHLPGLMFAVEGSTGRVHVLRTDRVPE